VDDAVADGDVERDALVAVLVPTTRTHGQDLALLGLLLGGVRDDETRGGRLLRLDGLDDDAVFERLDGNRHGGAFPSRVSTFLWSWCPAGAAVAGVGSTGLLALAGRECQHRIYAVVSTR